MDIQEIRPDFSIYVVDDEESIRSILTETLGGAGYIVSSYESAEHALTAIQQQPPHLILSDIRMPGMSGIQLLEKVRALSTDIEFIVMTSHASLETAVNAMRLGAYDYLHKPFENLEDVIKNVDRSIEKLYLKFENEQLLDELEVKNKELESLNKKISGEKEEVVKINQLMHAFASTKTTSDLIEVFVKKVSELTLSEKVLFLRHYPSHSSLILTNATGVPKDQIRKIGLSFKDSAPKEYMENLKNPENLDSLKRMIEKVFSVNEFVAEPLIIDEQVNGILVILKKVSDASIVKLMESFFQIFKINFVSSLMQERIHDMAIKDPLTGLFNRRYFNSKLDEEISRARRTKHPLSLIYMDIDHFKKYNDQNGHPMGDVLLKMVSTVLMKTSRRNDIVARVGGEEFVIILPHTNKEGAAIKAEKLRRTICGTQFPHGEKQPLGFVSMSMGVSEYPSIAGDGEALVKSADEALYQVKSTSRNRVCLAVADENYNPEYEPIKVESLRK